MLSAWPWPDEPNLALTCGRSCGHAFPRHFHDELHVCSYTEGRGHLRARGTTWSIASSDLVVTPVGEVHENWVIGNETCGFQSAYLQPEWLDALAAELLGRRACVVGWVHQDREHDVRAALARLHAARVDPDRLFRDECLARFVGAVVARCSLGQSAREDARSWPRQRAAVRRVRRILDERFDEAITLDELATISRLSRFHLQRVFTAEMGMGPHAYQTQVRINRAKELLRRDVPIAEVAARAGFADQSHLHRHFTRRVGITPGTYARGSR